MGFLGWKWPDLKGKSGQFLRLVICRYKREKVQKIICEKVQKLYKILLTRF